MVPVFDGVGEEFPFELLIENGGAFVFVVELAEDEGGAFAGFEGEVCFDAAAIVHHGQGHAGVEFDGHVFGIVKAAPRSDSSILWGSRA